MDGENQGAHKEDPRDDMEKGKRIDEPILNVDEEKDEERFECKESVEPVLLTTAEEWPREPEKKCGNAQENYEFRHGNTQYVCGRIVT